MSKRISVMYPVRVLFILLALLWLAGCSTTPDQKEPEIPAKHSVEDNVDPNVNYVVDRVSDPWGPMNRRIYNFNAQFDRYIFLPVVRGYEFITPTIVQTGVSNFFSNIAEITNFTNSVLQLKPEAAATAFSRFVWNTTIGVAGLWDPASHMGLPEWEEDFGQTLGHWGVGPGPYLVLPILGPSNLRDTTGLVADALTLAAVDPLNFDSNDDLEIPYYLLAAINNRHEVKFRYWETGSAFEYELIRLLYTKGRQIRIAK